MERYIDGHHRTKRKPRFILFLVFLFICFALLYSAFYEEGFLDIKKLPLDNKLLSFAILESKLDLENSIPISLDLTRPNLEIYGKISQIELSTDNVNSVLYVGNEKFDLTDLEKVVITIFAYEGKLSVSKDSLQLDGKADKILINDIVTSAKKDVLPIRLDRGLFYNSLKINEVYLDPFSYVSSGRIRLNDGKVTINVNEEEVSVGNFFGDFEIDGPNFKLNGNTDSLKVLGSIDVSVP